MAGGPVSVVVKVTGVKESLAAIRAIGGATKRATQQGTKEALDYLLKETLKVTPKKTGTLRKSGKVVMKRVGEVTEWQIVFTAPYAVWVHECVTDYHEPPTKAKFLQSTVNNPKHQSVARAIMRGHIAVAQFKAASKYRARRRGK